MRDQLLGGAALAAFMICAAAADRLSELERVVASERAFAERAQQVDAREAFVAFFAPDSILYAPFAVAAFPRLREGPDWRVNIQWRPVAAAISGAGDMGYTTGPSEYRNTAADPPFRFGHYTSVWQQQADGRYLVRIDIGIDHPAPSTRSVDWTTPARAPTAAPVLDPVQQAMALTRLRELDARIGTLASASAAEFAAVLAEDVRLHRGGRLPVIGRPQALADLHAHRESLGWTPEGAVISASGDFGFVYGRGLWKRPPPEAAGELVYLNIWQLRDREWRLIVHVSDAVRPRPPQ